MDSNDEAWKVFWCEHLSPVMLGEIPEGRREAYFRTLSERELLVPGGEMRRFSVRTWRRRWTELKLGGVHAVGRRRRRSDRGQPRQPHAELLKRAEQLEREQQFRSAQVINRILRREFGREVPRSTLYRHLKRVGATRRKLGIARQKIRRTVCSVTVHGRRFARKPTTTREHPNPSHPTANGGSHVGSYADTALARERLRSMSTRILLILAFLSPVVAASADTIRIPATDYGYLGRTDDATAGWGQQQWWKISDTHPKLL